jgi:hypothetical protein
VFPGATDLLAFENVPELSAARVRTHFQLLWDCAPVMHIEAGLLCADRLRCCQLFPYAQFCDTSPVPLYVLFDQIVKQVSTPSDHLEQAKLAVFVLFVNLEVLGELLDPLGEYRDLYLGRSCVGVVSAVVFDYQIFLLFSDHCFLCPFFSFPGDCADAVGVNRLIDPMTEYRAEKIPVFSRHYPYTKCMDDREYSTY